MRDGTVGTQMAGVGKIPTTPEIPTFVQDIGGSLVSLENVLADLAQALQPVLAEGLEGSNNNGRPYPMATTRLGKDLLDKVVTIDGLRDQVVALCARIKL